VPEGGKMWWRNVTSVTRKKYIKWGHSLRYPLPPTLVNAIPATLGTLIDTTYIVNESLSNERSIGTIAIKFEIFHIESERCGRQVSRISQVYQFGAVFGGQACCRQIGRHYSIL